MNKILIISAHRSGNHYLMAKIGTVFGMCTGGEWFNQGNLADPDSTTLKYRHDKNRRCSIELDDYSKEAYQRCEMFLACPHNTDIVK